MAQSPKEQRMTNVVGILAPFLTAALLVPMVGLAVQPPSAIQDELDALEAAMFAAVSVASAEDAERSATERLNLYRRGTPRSVEERALDTDVLAWWIEQGLSPIAARRAAIRHWGKERERRESHFQKQAAIYAEIAGVSADTAVERALAARDEYVSQFSAEEWSRMQARKERFEQWKLGHRERLLERRQQILEGLGDLDAVGPDGLSIRARACGQAFRERVEHELVQPILEPANYPTIHREGEVNQVVGIVRDATEARIERLERKITVTGEWGPCARGEEGMRAAHLALRELR